MIRISQIFLASFSILFFLSCSEDTSSEIVIDRPGVDQQLWVYFERFEYEARIRNQNIDLQAEGIIAEIEDIHDNGVAGQCSFGGNLPANQIVIDQNFWNNSSDLSREFVVFHELGHCSLYRGHLEDSNTNGSCVSIMRSGLGSCRDAYSASTRAFYLDELFFNRE